MTGRQVFKDELVRLAFADRLILCIEADLGSHNHPFQAAHPSRFFNMGIAESAAIDFATGLARAGFKPFVSTFASFAALRAAESLKLGLGYNGAPVTIAAAYGGVSGAWFGVTHHCLEDLGLLQAIPGIQIAVPVGEDEVRRAVRIAGRGEAPMYVRLGRDGVFSSVQGDTIFPVPHVVWERNGAERSDICLISVGEKGTEICSKLRLAYPDLAHVHIVFVHRPYLDEICVALADLYDTLVVVEEHRLAGGVASTIALLCPKLHVVSHNCGLAWPWEGGSHDEVLHSLGFGVESLRGLMERLPRHH